ncbi:MAG: phenylacetate--CoA ligase family protein [Psychroflexus sp.]|uniref:AMP-binding protein n=1 Tax=Psychroflexus sp. S27 TaxID=1982757 RepID=UPI000C2AD097|nr:AMP-binding protein [Psychroflexus sp. S27]PJX27544.1 AMP-binding protein [Psychroflexus sp. S27]
MNYFKLALKLKGFPIDKALVNYNNIDEISQKNFIFNHHLKNNSFYKNLIGNRPIEDWQSIPILTKDMLQVPLKERIADQFKFSQLYISKTSGSSGFPFIYGKDKYSHAMTWAHILSLYKSVGIDYSKSYQARFYAIPKEFIAYRKELLKDFFSKRKRFIIFNLSDNKLDEFITLFKKNKFDYVYGYTSSIVLFAKHLNKKGLFLKDICPTLKLCLTTSEMLYDFDRKLLEEQFKIPVFNEYGSSELGLIAFENDLGQFIVNDKTLYVEIVDEFDNIVEDGTVGRIIVTSLFNKAHPFVRYEVGDLGAIEYDENGGCRVLKTLIGRSNEFAILPSNKRVPAFTFCYVAKSIAEESTNVKELKVVQETKSKFTIEYSSLKPLEQIQKNKISAAIETYLEPGLTIQFKRFEQLERSKSGKLKQFISKVNQHA